MTSADFLALLPLLVTALSSLIVLLITAFRRNHLLVAVVTSLGLMGALMTLPVASQVAPRHVTPLLLVDAYAIFYSGLLLAAGLAVTGLSYGYLEKRAGQHEEFYVLLLLATLGAITLAAATHFASFFLGLELLSVSLYVLIAYVRTDKRPIEAGIKYMILSGASSSFLLFGMALVYFHVGTMEFARMAVALDDHVDVPYPFLVGLVLILTGVGFKLAVVPFHMWASDVYEGAPAPVTAFVATVSKGAVMALFVRYWLIVDGARYESLWLVLSLIAGGSMCVGNLLALWQENVKRILAYSSIAHLGYLFVAILASGTMVVEAVTFYLVAYFIATLGAFGIVTVLSRSDGDAAAMHDYRGLYWRRPGLGGVLTVMLLSLAGIPLTAGFMGKFYIITVGVQSALWVLLILLVLNSVIGLFYYLRIIVWMSTVPAEAQPRVIAIPVPDVSWTEHVVLAMLTILLVWLGLYPSPFIRMIQSLS